MVDAIINSLESEQADRAEMLKTNAMGSIELVFRNFHQPTDEKLFTELLPHLNNDLESEFLPSVFRDVMGKYDKQKLLKRIYRKSVLSNKAQLVKLLETSNEKQILKLRKDPMIELVNSLNFYYEVNLLPVVDSLRDNINNNMKIYMAGIMDMQKDQPLYPDANLTLRVAYGKVEGYEPQDGIEYKYYTTLSGLMEKDNPAIYEYSIPEKLKELYNNKDFGIFAVDGEMPVCFTASNHTSGGNSGSPVINGNGELVGVNFDRCWEATMSDIMYDPEMCRNISIDIRYALFIIDKFAGAGYLLDEMKIVE